MMKIEISKEAADLVYRALLAHDGGSLRPEWTKEEQTDLTRALDRLRLALIE